MGAKGARRLRLRTSALRGRSDPRTSGSLWLERLPVRGPLHPVLRLHWMTPARLLLVSFAGLILVGTVGFRTLPGLYVGEPLSWSDALFTATSAVCVTGLIVVDTSTRFSVFGQAYLLVLIQLGGLGILTFTTVVILAMGRRLSLHHRAAAIQGSEPVPDIDFRKVLRGVLLFTLLFEGIGTLLLFVAWLAPMGVRDAAWSAVFHAVSAYCNAGFSIFSDSLVGFRTSPLVLFVIMFLIVVGGIGFLTLTELQSVIGRGRGGRRRRLSPQARIVLTTTGALLAVGWVAYTLLEWRGALGDMALGHRFLNALFMSVTARTAGFNTVDYGDLTPGSSVVTMFLMAVGGSPGSTAGGMKTTTFAVLLLAAWARLRGRHEMTVGGRAVAEDALQRALVLWVAGSILLALAMLALSVVELPATPAQEPFLPVLFESVSALNTVGLSMNVTGDLTNPGKMVITILMYLGRVGPIAAATALVPVTNGRRDLISHARVDITVG